MLAPHHGKVYDPCCGSGGMFVQSEKFIEAHGGKLGDVSIYGQESNPTTWRLAAMNLAIRGIDFNLGREPADTFTRNQHPDLRADFILANPPFNISDWWHGSLEGDPRWEYGTPPQGNANYAWLQHMLLPPEAQRPRRHRAGQRLDEFQPEQRGRHPPRDGRCRRGGSDDRAARATVLQHPDSRLPVVPGQAEAAPGKGEVLFIDARKLGSMISRVQAELTDEVIERIAGTVAAWRGQTAARVTTPTCPATAAA